MSRRNLILFIIVLVIITSVFFVFLFSNRGASGTPENPDGENFFSKWNPFDNKPNNPGNNEPGENPGENPGEFGDSRLRRVSSMPVAGYGVFQKERIKEGTVAEGAKPETEFVPAIRYVEKENGIIYQTFADNIQEKKFSSTVIPKVYEAFFGNGGDSVAVRYLKNSNEVIETFLGTLPKEFVGEPAKEDHEIKGTFLPEGTTDISISSDSLRAFYLFNVGENSVGTIIEFLNNRRNQIFESPFTEWLSQFPNNRIITLNTKASSEVQGHLYKIDLGTRALSRIMGGINGLTTLTSPSGNMVLFAGNNLNLGIYNTSTRETSTISLQTLPEKCVWSPDEEYIYCAVPKDIPIVPYPDSWYQGDVSFNDEIWRINVSTKTASVLLNPASERGGEEVDAIRLSLDEAKNHLFFINKKDNFLWKFDFVK